jgi:NADH:ubiquinone oxidoreductase subunit 2 (subunit N)
LTIWISKIYDKKPQSITDASTAALTLVLVGIIVYFVCENIIFYSSMAYTFSPWFVLIFALSGVLSKNHKRNDIPDRNKFYALALLIICCILVVVRLGLFIVRYMKR